MMSCARRVLIHVDERRRDVAVLLALGRLFERAGCRVTFSTRRTTALWLRRCRFDAVLVPYVPHIPYEDLPRVSARCKIYMLPTEGALFGEWPLLVKYGGGSVPERWDRQIHATARFFLWGEHSRRVLQATGRFRDEQLVVVGAPRAEFSMADPSPPPHAADDPRSIGVLSEFSMLNSYNRLHLFDVINHGRRGHGVYYAWSRHIEDRFWKECAWLRVLLELIEACQRRGERLRIRIHPREDPRGYQILQRTYPGVIDLDGQELPFEAWLGRVGVLLGYNSTTFFEAVAANRPAISLEGFVGPRLQEHLDGLEMNHYPIMDHLETPTSLEELFALIQMMRQGRWTGYGPECRALLKDVYHYPRAASALATVVQTVVQDLDGARPDGGFSDRLAETLGRWEANALETATFTLRRDPVTSAWFPLRLGRFARQHAEEIARYVRAAERFPAKEAAAPASPDAQAAVSYASVAGGRVEG